MADDRTLDATGEPLDYSRLDPERPARERERLDARRFRQLPPGRIGAWGRRSQRNASTVHLGVYACCVALVLLGSRLTTGQWLHAWSALLTLVLTYCLLALFALLNRRRT
jgi:hypothetical protein